MYFFYNILVIISGWFLVPVSLFNKKIKLFLNGRKETFKKLSIIKENDKVIWFHCASLGEFEQGRPLIENLKLQIPSLKSYKIVLTFFSPSGYEIRKNYEFADVICYLPLDSKKKVKLFLDKIHPEIAIFVKYEFWPNILKELKIRKINTLLVSAIFRENQVFFKSNKFANRFMQNSLKAFNHFFVQDSSSKELLNSINYHNVTISGDTRFDSVYKTANQDNNLFYIEKFINKKTNFVLVAGSTWKKDENLLVEYINNNATKNQQFIIAPHNIKSVDLRKLKNSITKKAIFYSDLIKDKKSGFEQVLIVDTIGILSKIYGYANVAFVGGGFGSGIHNILEPATFGLPIIIGPNYNKFKEAIDLIDKKGCFVIKNRIELEKIMGYLQDELFFKTAGNITNQYILDNIGATKCIISYIKKIMPNFTV